MYEHKEGPKNTQLLYSLKGYTLHSPKRFAEETPYTDDLVYATVDTL